MQIESIPLLELLRDACLALAEKCTTNATNPDSYPHELGEKEKQMDPASWAKKKFEASEMATQIDYQLKKAQDDS